MAEHIKFYLLEHVTPHKEILLAGRGLYSNREKQSLWKKIHKILTSKKLIPPLRDWKWIRNTWYRLTRNAKRNLQEFKEGNIDSLNDFDKKILMVCGIPLEKISQEIAVADQCSNNDNDNDHVNDLDLLEITEHKMEIPCINNVPIESNDMREYNFLKRKVYEQKYKLQQYELLKTRYEIMNIKNKRLRESLLKVL